MTKYKIEVTEDQLLLIAVVLEDVSRFAAGHMKMHNIVDFILQEKDFDSVEDRIKSAHSIKNTLKSMKQSVHPELALNESYGYNSTDFIGNLYQLYKQMYYAIAKEEGWNNVHSSKPLKSGNMGIPKIEKIEE